jgi:hypothetical protein
MVIASGIKTIFRQLDWLLEMDNACSACAFACRVKKKSFTPKQRVFDSDGNFRNHHFQYNTLLRWKNNFGGHLSLIVSIPIFIVAISRIAFKEKISAVKHIG